MKTAVYFAFGSNLDLAQMRRRCPSAVPQARATLHGYRIAFAGHSTTWGGGVATVVHDHDAKVEGMIYLLSVQDLAALDRFEGAPFVYERRMKTVVDEQGRRRRVQVYRIADELAEEALPGPRYFDTIVRAYQRLGFDRAPLADAVGGAARNAIDRVDRARALTRLFVYGTLLAGEPNHRILQGATFVGPAYTQPHFRMVSLGACPAIVPDGSTSVAGEAYDVDGTMLARVDELEGHPDFYTRTPILLDDGTAAQAYLLRPTQVRGASEILSGKWRRRNQEAT